MAAAPLSTARPRTPSALRRPCSTLKATAAGDASNGVNKLYSQLLAAKLNIFRGASPAAINSILAAADSFLAANSSSDWNSLSKSAKTQVNNWHSTFDQYNNGLIGPGHCN